MRLPDASLDQVSESGGPLAEADGVARAYQDGDVVVVEVGSGHYQFAYLAPELFAQLEAARRLSTNDTLKKLWEDERAREILIKHLPELQEMPPMWSRRAMGFTLRQMAARAPEMLPEGKLDAIDQELAQLGKQADPPG